MHYYKRNIGDYAKKAGKLSMLQHGAYTLLIDACYDRERFPTLEDAIDWVWADTPEQVEAVKFVLHKFFKLEDGVYVQDRITEELSSYKELSEVNSRIAKERELKKKARFSTEREPFVHEPAPNHEPLTTNHEPLTIDKPAKRSIPPIAKPDDVTEQTWDDWCSLRKLKKAKVSQTVINGAVSEADKAGLSLEEFLKIWCLRGSQGLEASWLKPHERQNTPQQKTFAERDREAGWKRWEEQTGRTHPERMDIGQVIDITPRQLEIER